MAVYGRILMSTSHQRIAMMLLASSLDVTAARYFWASLKTSEFGGRPGSSASDGKPQRPMAAHALKRSKSLNGAWA
jgi:hypothetical protein